jgi:type IV secretion system protein VirD4
MPTLENVRGMLTGDLAGNARRLFDSGDFQIASLVGRFMAENRTNDGIRSTADTFTRWLLSAPMRADLAKDGIDFGRLKDKPTTVYVILPADKLETFSVWLRLVVASALNALYRRGGEGLRTLFMLSEFAQLGHLKPIMSALGQGRGYGIQLWPVLQDLNQLRTIYGKDAANTFLGMSGATFGFTPNDPETAEWMSRRSGETWEPGLTASDDPNAPGARESWRSERRRIYPPDDLYNIPEFHGLVWLAGQSRAVPVYAPPYFDARANPDLGGRFDPDPYHANAA